MTTPSLFDWIMDLLRNDHAREAFQANPQAAMASAGFSNACSADVADAKPFVLDNPAVGVKGVHTAPDTSDTAVDHVNYIVNNYTYKTENHYFVDKPSDGPDNDIDDSTVTDSQNTSTVSDDDGNATQGGVIVSQDGSQAGDDMAGRDANDTNIEGNVGHDSYDATVSGDNSAGHDLQQVSGENAAGRDNESVNVSGENAAGRDNESVNGNGNVGHDAVGGDQDVTRGGLAALDHTVETGDIHVLSDLVNTGDVLENGNVLNDLVHDFDSINVLQQVDHVIVGPLL